MSICMISIMYVPHPFSVSLKGQLLLEAPLEPGNAAVLGTEVTLEFLGCVDVMMSLGSIWKYHVISSQDFEVNQTY